MCLIEKYNANEEKSFMRGEIIHTIFHNANEHFSIVKIKIHETNEDYKEDEIVIKGHFSNLQSGMVYSFFGQMENHPKFGTQYNIEHYQTYIPSDEDGLISYLSSDLFYGVGEKTAKRIVDHLGIHAIRKIIDNPEIIYEVPSINKKTA